MSILVVAGVTVTVRQDGGVAHRYEEVGGDRVRMDDNSLAVTVKTLKNVWTIVTSLYDSATAATLEAAVVGAPPLTCTGDLLGASFSCAGVLLEKERVPIGGSIYFRVHFELREI